MEVLEREGDALHGSGAAPLVGVVEEVLELVPVAGPGIGDGHRGDDGLGRAGSGRSLPAPVRRGEGVGEAGAGQRRATEAGELLRQRRHFCGLASPPARSPAATACRAPSGLDWVRERFLSD